jgi:dethiobiotin synthetase
MAKGIFITGTGTDVGKTYVSAILVKRLKCGYYKPVLSGFDPDDNDCKHVTGADDCVSYTFIPPVSPHLAAQLEGVVIEPEKIKADFERITSQFDYVVVEGAGGIVCPLGDNLMQTDIIKMLGLNIIIVADAGLGTINAAVLAVEHAKKHNLNIDGIIFNRYNESNFMHKDNKKQIEALTGIKVIECIGLNEI